MVLIFFVHSLDYERYQKRCGVRLILALCCCGAWRVGMFWEMEKNHENDSSPVISKNCGRIGGFGNGGGHGVGVATDSWWSGDAGNGRNGIPSSASFRRPAAPGHPSSAASGPGKCMVLNCFVHLLGHKRYRMRCGERSITSRGCCRRAVGSLDHEP